MDIKFEDKEISIISFINYTQKRNGNGDYSLGGFYLIYNNFTKKGYIGKSVNVMSRLRHHYYLAKSKKGIRIDLELAKDIDSYKYYLIDSYRNLGINFFNRKLEGVYEKYYIKKYKTYFPNGFNMQKL